VTPFLLDLFTNHRVSALICPSDYYAKQIYLWCHNAGYAIPGDLSIISFDNRADRYTGSLSSIEFGFGHLGYAAFHTITGDIGRQAGGGKIRPRAGVHDCGSLSMPHGESGRSGHSGVSSSSANLFT
jgi:DNA-binding LacI/PurR family transcriptional regulator